MKGLACGPPWGRRSSSTVEESPLAAFVKSPVGKWSVGGCALVWCKTPSLCGALLWGKPSREQVREITGAFEGYAKLERRFDVILDASRVEGVDLEALEVLVDWLRLHRTNLIERVRLQRGIAPPGAIGFLVAGILPILGETHPFRIFDRPEDAYVEALGSASFGAALATELDGIVARARAMPVELSKLRALLREHPDTIDAPRAAEQLRMPVRTFQRLLAHAGTSFREELRQARFAKASELLRGSDVKLAVVAARLGISERALHALFRDIAGTSPADHRRG